MKLLTKAIETQLSKPGLTGQNAQVPICKFFNPCGAATWLIFAREKGEDSDTLWGLADLGMGCVEYGTISLSELQSLRLSFGLGIERDLHWTPKKHANGELWKLSDYLKLDSLSGM
jgi:hypothetical protein